MASRRQYLGAFLLQHHERLAHLDHELRQLDAHALRKLLDHDNHVVESVLHLVGHRRDERHDVTLERVFHAVVQTADNPAASWFQERLVLALWSLVLNNPVGDVEDEVGDAAVVPSVDKSVVEASDDVVASVIQQGARVFELARDGVGPATEVVVDVVPLVRHAAFVAADGVATTALEPLVGAVELALHLVLHVGEERIDTLVLVVNALLETSDDLLALFGEVLVRVCENLSEVAVDVTEELADGRIRLVDASLVAVHRQFAVLVNPLVGTLEVVLNLALDSAKELLDAIPSAVNAILESADDVLARANEGADWVREEALDLVKDAAEEVGYGLPSVRDAREEALHDGLASGNEGLAVLVLWSLVLDNPVKYAAEERAHLLPVPLGAVYESLDESLTSVIQELRWVLGEVRPALLYVLGEELLDAIASGTQPLHYLVADFLAEPKELAERVVDARKLLADVLQPLAETSERCHDRLESRWDYGKNGTDEYADSFHERRKELRKLLERWSEEPPEIVGYVLEGRVEVLERLLELPADVIH